MLSKQIVGVEFSPSVLYGVKVLFKGKKVEDVKWTKIDLKEGWFEQSKIIDLEALRNALIDMTQKLNINRTLDAVTCVYSPVAMSNVFTLPVKNARELFEYLELEADKIVPLPLSILNVDYYFLEKGKDSSKVLLAFAKKEIVYKYRDLMIHAGLRLKSVSVRSVALTNFALYALGMKSIPIDNYIFLDANEEVLSYSILNGLSVVTCRDIPLGRGLFVDDVIEFLDKELKTQNLNLKDFTFVITKRAEENITDFINKFANLSKEDVKKIKLFEFVDDFDKNEPCIDIAVGLTLQELKK